MGVLSVASVDETKMRFFRKERFAIGCSNVVRENWLIQRWVFFIRRCFKSENHMLVVKKRTNSI